jgi:hypothetical protein
MMLPLFIELAERVEDEVGVTRGLNTDGKNSGR